MEAKALSEGGVNDGDRYTGLRLEVVRIYPGGNCNLRTNKLPASSASKLKSVASQGPFNLPRPDNRQRSNQFWSDLAMNNTSVCLFMKYKDEGQLAATGTDRSQ